MLARRVKSLRAFDASGARDSAAVHYQRVVAAWERGDPEFKTRAARARRWLQRYEATKAG
jgi:hypothetical protein